MLAWTDPVVGQEKQKAKDYLAMLPNLTETEKAQLKTWLLEARDNAMIAENSKGIHR